MESRRAGQPPVTPALLGLIALRQHELNRAVGISHVTPQVLALLQAYQQRVKEETGRYAQAVFLSSIIKDRRKRFKVIQEKILTTVDIDQKRKLLKDALTIQGEIERAVKELSAIDRAKE